MHVNLLHLHWVMFYKKGKIILRLYLVLTLAKYLEMFMSVMRKLNDHCWMKMLCLECVSVVYVAFLLIYHCCFVFSHELEWPFWNILVLVLTSDFSFFFVLFLFFLRAHRNDMENIYPFLFLGAIYSMIGPSLSVARGHFLVFFLARVMHTVAYLFALRAPSRSLSYIIAQLPCVSMAIQIVIAVAAYAWYLHSLWLDPTFFILMSGGWPF